MLNGLMDIAVTFLIIGGVGLVVFVVDTVWSDVRMAWRFAEARRVGQLAAAKRRHPAGKKL